MDQIIKTFNKITLIISAALGAIATRLGGFDMLLRTVLTLLILDFILGFGHAFFTKQVESRRMREGITKIIMTFVLVFLAYHMQLFTGISYIREVVLTYIVVNESISILEHIERSNVSTPQFLKKILEVLKQTTDQGKLSEDWKPEKETNTWQK